MWPVTSSEPWQPTGKRHGWTAYLCPLLLGAQGSLSRAPGFKTSGASQEAAPPPRHEARRCLEVTPVGRWPEPSAPAHTHALPRAKAAPSLPSLLFGHENNPALSGVATGSHCPGQALGSLGHHQPGLWVLPRVPRVPGTGTRLFTGLVSPPTLTAHHRHTHTHLHPPTHTQTRGSGMMQLPWVPAPQVWAGRPVGLEAVCSGPLQVTLRNQSPRAPGRGSHFPLLRRLFFERVFSVPR